MPRINFNPAQAQPHTTTEISGSSRYAGAGKSRAANIDARTAGITRGTDEMRARDTMKKAQYQDHIVNQETEADLADTSSRIFDLSAEYKRNLSATKNPDDVKKLTDNFNKRVKSYAKGKDENGNAYFRHDLGRRSFDEQSRRLTQSTQAQSDDRVFNLNREVDFQKHNNLFARASLSDWRNPDAEQGIRTAIENKVEGGFITTEQGKAELREGLSSRSRYKITAALSDWKMEDRVLDEEIQSLIKNDKHLNDEEKKEYTRALSEMNRRGIEQREDAILEEEARRAKELKSLQKSEVDKYESSFDEEGNFTMPIADLYKLNLPQGKLQKLLAARRIQNKRLKAPLDKEKKEAAKRSDERLREMQDDPNHPVNKHNFNAISKLIDEYNPAADEDGFRKIEILTLIESKTFSFTKKALFARLTEAGSDKFPQEDRSLTNELITSTLQLGGEEKNKDEFADHSYVQRLRDRQEFFTKYKSLYLNKGKEFADQWRDTKLEEIRRDEKIELFKNKYTK